MDIAVRRSPTRELIVRSGDLDRFGGELEDLVPDQIMEFVRNDVQRSIPAIAKDQDTTARIDRLLREVPTTHRIILGDSRRVVADLPRESVHLAITSPPYWTLKVYKEHPDQLGHIHDYEEFLDAIDVVWEGVRHALVPGGRLVIVVGDVLLSRRKFGRHVVVPLHASIQERCRALGYDNLSPIVWHKIANATLEMDNGSSFLGKPYEPNAIIKSDIEFILFQRKPGGYRNPSLAARVLSVIPEELHHQWFQQIWEIGGASTRHHPAPFPSILAERLIRMFSFVGDTVLDPFLGTGTCSIAAAKVGRNSIGVEVEPSYFDIAEAALRDVQQYQKHLAV